MYDALGNLSLELFRAFEAAARQQSFTAAAIELGTTQPAISQQIKRLEEQLGTRLFDRIYRGIELTEAGTILFEQVQAGLQSIDAGLSAITAQHQHEVLQVATDFAFAAYWLMPRLHRFHAANPQVDVSLVTSERNHNMLRTDIDVAVLFGDGRFKQGESRWLFSEEVFPVCSPLLLKDRPLPLSAQALAEFPLLHLRAGNSNSWFEWSGVFRELGITSPPAPGQLRFDNYTLLIQAAIGGQGVAIGWRHLVDNLLAQGLLCRPIAETVLSRLGYYVVLPQRKRRGVLIRQFVDWLMEEQVNSAESLTGLPLPSIAV
ncbi:choline sulfate utilization transcriptional regulator [Pseudomonas brassicacearum]|uniref:Putative transcription factor, LysR family n=1 Tax=Pseudomonas brassicacearum (strain NFM421) TaxID=994484 RepID=F2KAI7_PSEBN|nr:MULTISPECIES: LysR family transcriptional regulator [Pseudomonas]EIK65669.1 putative choline sulfate-utilization transcription factor [Pseudomonas fluorescens Q8r1-96]KIR17177.1 Glycine cleavage system transcriptional activator [Pseudomonas fluorescens]AEA66186.1 Putative transcription factor, LysR family [Pseudomonas brassicacearum subsp. brassicacearum NFM421]AOS40205.1 LysR family transcriptional regulator [Pseudomonas brassicacearum]KAB0527208.1 LysR family transcriptional regulator [Ps